MNALYREAKKVGIGITSLIATKVENELIFNFPSVDIKPGSTLSEAILKINNSTGELFVFIFDEYDVIIRESASKEELDEYLDLLIRLFKNLNISKAIALSYITGILPIVRDKLQSKLNNFDEYTSSWNKL